jgi:hypothetical protein
LNILTFRDHQISQRTDGFVNATQMAKANDARLDNYFASPETQKYLKALQESIKLESSELVELVIVAGFGADKATWMHPLAAIHFAQWISAEFHVWCNRHIKTLIESGETKLEQDLSARSECGMLIGSAIESCIDAKLAKELQLIFSYFHGMQATIDRQQAETQQLKQTVEVLESLSRRQSGEDIRMRIAEVLDDPERKYFSNIKIAAICRCSESMVRKFKDERNGKFRDDDDNFEVQVKVKIPNPWKK